MPDRPWVGDPRGRSWLPTHFSQGGLALGWGHVRTSLAAVHRAEWLDCLSWEGKVGVCVCVSMRPLGEK